MVDDRAGFATTGRLSHQAKTGATAHSISTGAAAASAAGRPAATMMATTTASAGLASIAPKNSTADPRPLKPVARAAVAAAVSHSSSRRWVTISRIRVSRMACAIS